MDSMMNLAVEQIRSSTGSSAVVPKVRRRRRCCLGVSCVLAPILVVSLRCTTSFVGINSCATGRHLDGRNALSTIAIRATGEATVLDTNKTIQVNETGEPAQATYGGVKQEDDVDPWTYFFGKPGELRRDAASLNTSPERIILAALIAPTFGLVANLWGETEFVMSVFPSVGDFAVERKLDTLYAVKGLRGYYESDYEVHYPSTWLFDQRVQLSKMGQSDPSGGMYTTNNKKPPSSKTQSMLPDAAWGPAGGGQRTAKERENLSVVRQLLPPKRDGTPQDIVEILGDAEPSLQKLLTEKIAPEGSKRKAEALRAEAVTRQGGQGNKANTYYEYQWRTRFEKADFALRTYSSVALGPPDKFGGRYLYTLTAVIPDEEAVQGSGVAAQIPQILERFHVYPN